MNMQEIYILSRDELTELFQIGKRLKQRGLDKDEVHQYLLPLTYPKPSLTIAQVDWWICTTEDKLTLPDWMVELKKELDERLIDEY